MKIRKNTVPGSSDDVSIKHNHKSISNVRISRPLSQRTSSIDLKENDIQKKKQFIFNEEFIKRLKENRSHKKHHTVNMNNIVRRTDINPVYTQSPLRVMQQSIDGRMHMIHRSSHSSNTLHTKNSLQIPHFQHRLDNDHMERRTVDDRSSNDVIGYIKGKMQQRVDGMLDELVALNDEYSVMKKRIHMLDTIDSSPYAPSYKSILHAHIDHISRSILVVRAEVEQLDSHTTRIHDDIDSMYTINTSMMLTIRSIKCKMLMHDHLKSLNQPSIQHTYEHIENDMGVEMMQMQAEEDRAGRRRMFELLYDTIMHDDSLYEVHPDEEVLGLLNLVRGMKGSMCHD